MPSDTPTHIQLARTVRATLVFDMALKWFTPAAFAGAPKQFTSLLLSTRKWLNTILLALQGNRIAGPGEVAITRALDTCIKYVKAVSTKGKCKRTLDMAKAAENISFRKIALLYAGQILLQDAKNTCPAYANGLAWYWLMRQSDKLCEQITGAFDGTAEEGTRFYMQLHGEKW